MVLAVRSGTERNIACEVEDTIGSTFIVHEGTVVRCHAFRFIAEDGENALSVMPHLKILNKLRGKQVFVHCQTAWWDTWKDLLPLWTLIEPYFSWNICCIEVNRIWRRSQRLEAFAVYEWTNIRIHRWVTTAPPSCFGFRFAWQWTWTIGTDTRSNPEMCHQQTDTKVSVPVLVCGIQKWKDPPEVESWPQTAAAWWRTNVLRLFCPKLETRTRPKLILVWCLLVTKRCQVVKTWLGVQQNLMLPKAKAPNRVKARFLDLVQEPEEAKTTAAAVRNCQTTTGRKSSSSAMTVMGMHWSTNFFLVSNGQSVSSLGPLHLVKYFDFYFSVDLQLVVLAFLSRQVQYRPVLSRFSKSFSIFHVLMSTQRMRAMIFLALPRWLECLQCQTALIWKARQYFAGHVSVVRIAVFGWCK